MTSPSEHDVILVSSNGRCGIHEYSNMLSKAFQALGHNVSQVTIEYQDHGDLSSKLSEPFRPGTTVIFEYTPEIFDPVRLASEFHLLKNNGAKLILSLHDINHGNIYRPGNAKRALSDLFSFRLPIIATRLAYRIVTQSYSQARRRKALQVLGKLSDEIIIHSEINRIPAEHNFEAISKIRYVPHFIEGVQGSVPPASSSGASSDGGDAGTAVRFLVPGFITPGKRILEIMDAAPADAELVIAGTVRRDDIETDVAYLERIIEKQQALKGVKSIRIVNDYDQLHSYLLSSDVAVFYYEHGSQSGMASLAVGAGLPCVFSNAPAFDHLKPAGLVASTTTELTAVMSCLLDPSKRSALATNSAALADQMSPESCAAQYLSPELSLS
jgi:hypothetical protein